MKPTCLCAKCGSELEISEGRLKGVDDNGQAFIKVYDVQPCEECIDEARLDAAHQAERWVDYANAMSYLSK